MSDVEQERLSVLGWPAPDDTFRARIFCDRHMIWECTHAHQGIGEAWTCGKHQAARRAGLMQAEGNRARARRAVDQAHAVSGSDPRG